MATPPFRLLPLHTRPTPAPHPHLPAQDRLTPEQGPAAAVAAGELPFPRANGPAHRGTDREPPRAGRRRKAGRGRGGRGVCGEALQVGLRMLDCYNMRRSMWEDMPYMELWHCVWAGGDAALGGADVGANICR
eukprot:235178-Chlamydomonas_euryale.AAC.8